MVDADRQAHVVHQPQILEDQLGEAAGVAEDDGGAVGLDLGHHLLGGIAPRMARPGDAILGQQDMEVGLGAGIAIDQGDRIDVAARREPGAIGIRIGHRRRQRHAAERRREMLEPGHAQSEQIATLAGGEGVDLVDDDGLERFEQEHAVGVAEQQAQRFRRGQEHVGRPGALACLAIGRRVAGAGFDRDRQPHILDRAEQIAPHIHRQRLERRDVERVQPLARAFDEIGETGEEARERLAGAGRRHEQGVGAGAGGIDHFELIAPRRPAAGREPVGKHRRQTHENPLRHGEVACRRHDGGGVPQAQRSSGAPTTIASQ